MPAPVDVNTILYVEDDEMVRMATAMILKMKYPCCNLMLAVNGKEGLEIFRLYRPAIVITDIVMPIMDGLQMANNICNWLSLIFSIEKSTSSISLVAAWVIFSSGIIFFSSILFLLK